MRRFAIVFRQEFKETLRSKPFIVISVFLALLLGVAALIGFLTFDDGAADNATEAPGAVVDYTEDASAGAENAYEYYVAFDNRADAALADRLREALPFVRFEDISLDDADPELAMITSALDSGADACVILRSAEYFDIYETASMYGTNSLSSYITGALDELARIDSLAALGVSESDAKAVLSQTGAYGLSHQIGGYGIGKYIYNILMVILMFLIIGLYGQMVSTRVATEKSSRTMEVLATTVSPGELLCGKVMGVGAAGLLQIVLFMLGGVGIIRGLAARSVALSFIAGQLMEISTSDIVYMCLYFLLGFLLYAFVFGGLGSMVSQVEDLSGTASLPLYVFMIGYFLSIFSTSSGIVSPFMRVASFIPFWSPIIMFSRMSIEQVPHTEVVISLALLAATSLLAAWFSARVYRTGMLRYGKPPKLKEIISAVKK